MKNFRLALMAFAVLSFTAFYSCGNATEEATEEAAPVEVVEEAPVVEEVVEEAPADEMTAEEAPAEEAPVEEVPAQ